MRAMKIEFCKKSLFADNGITFFRYHFPKNLFLFLFSLFGLQLFAVDQSASIIPPPQELPVVIYPSLFINRIYNINTVTESFEMDGYLECTWQDKRLVHSGKCLTIDCIAENQKVDEIIGQNIWFPSFELINTQGSRNIHNRSLIIKADGRVVYTERFNGVFSADFNYRTFPFDKQEYKIIIESFSYDNRYCVFAKPKLFPVISDSKNIIDKWDVKTMDSKLSLEKYDAIQNFKIYQPLFSRVSFVITANRLSGFYLWQVFLPLMIIIFASFMIFWIKDFNNQIQIGFTLMLTVVAFNFYSVSILPQLPYNTFIETTIILGYMFIFFNIIAVVINHRIYSAKVELEDTTLIKVFRWLFPCFYVFSMILLCINYYL